MYNIHVNMFPSFGNILNLHIYMFPSCGDISIYLRSHRLGNVCLYLCFQGLGNMCICLCFQSLGNICMYTGRPPGRLNGGSGGAAAPHSDKKQVCVVGAVARDMNQCRQIRFSVLLQAASHNGARMGNIYRKTQNPENPLRICVCLTWHLKY
jgi:hypothetical protein